jgi:hypothetical protein
MHALRELTLEALTAVVGGQLPQCNDDQPIKGEACTEGGPGPTVPTPPAPPAAVTPGSPAPPPSLIAPPAVILRRGG